VITAAPLPIREAAQQDDSIVTSIPSHRYLRLPSRIIERSTGSRRASDRSRDSRWQLVALRLESRTSAHLVRIQSTQNKNHAEIIAAIDRGMAEGGITYVHCWGGVGRTRLAVACWLQEHGQTPDEALTDLADKWRSCAKSQRMPNSPETAEQVRWVKEWPLHRSTLKSRERLVKDTVAPYSD